VGNLQKVVRLGYHDWQFLMPNRAHHFFNRLLPIDSIVPDNTILTPEADFLPGEKKDNERNKGNGHSPCEAAESVTHCKCNAYSDGQGIALSKSAVSDLCGNKKNKR